MHVEFAREQHTNQIIELWRQCFGDSKAFISFYLEHHPYHENTLLLALEGDIVTSMLSLLPARLVMGTHVHPVRYVYAVGTDIRFRGQGISTLLLNAATEVCRQWQEDGLFLIPASSSLFDFYQARGFLTAFGIETKEIMASSLSKPSSTIQVRPMDLPTLYTLRCNGFGQLPFYIGWQPKELAYAVEASKAALGGVYGFYHEDTPLGYTFYEPYDDGIYLKEWCVPSDDSFASLCALHSVLHADRYRLRLPGSSPFGMIRWTRDPLVLPKALGYANLILD